MACGTQMMWILFLHTLKIVDKNAGTCICGSGAFRYRVVFYVGEYGTYNDLCIECRNHCSLCTILCGSDRGDIFQKLKSRGVNFSVGFVIAIIGIAMISMNGAKSLHLNPKGDMLAFTAMISWGFYSAIIKKIGEWDVTVFKKAGDYT